MDAVAQAGRIGEGNKNTIFQETIPSVFRPKKPQKEEKTIKTRRMSADRRLRSSDAHVSRTNMASRRTQTECETLSEEKEKTKARRLSRASLSGAGRHVGVASPYSWRLGSARQSSTSPNYYNYSHNHILNTHPCTKNTTLTNTLYK